MERKKSPLYKVFDCVDLLENIIVGVALVGMFFTIMAQIIGRLIAHPFPWTEETTRYLFIWMMFIALAAGFNKAESSRVVLLLNAGPNWLKRFSELLYAVIVIGFFGFMVVFGWELVMQQKMLNEMGTALRIPMTIVGLCVPFSGVLGMVGTVQSFLEYRGNVTIPDKLNAETGGISAERTESQAEEKRGGNES